MGDEGDTENLHPADFVGSRTAWMAELQAGQNSFEVAMLEKQRNE